MAMERRWATPILAAHLLIWMSMSAHFSVHADPVLAPELKYCHLPQDLPEGETPFNCCAPDWDKPPVDFEFKEGAQQNVRVRMSAHAMDAHHAAKLDKAYGLMKALPQDDPRSFFQQANIHCAYCDSTYQMGNSTKPFQVHASWLFFSFHRWYLYFHERILAHLLIEADDEDDGTFAVPFWNYDHPDGMMIPSAFMSFGNLTDILREPSHLPPSIAMLDYYYMNASIRTPEEQIQANLATMHRMVVSGATTQDSFFGAPYRKDNAPMPGYGTVETMPHNSIHGWTGDQKQIGNKDMGSLYAAGRDPLFYAHHANIDRLWEIWKRLDSNEDISDPDYLESEFVFYNEHAELVKVKVKDSLDSIKLGYTYADVENMWINVTPPRLSDGVAKISGRDNVCIIGNELVEVCSVMLTRDAKISLQSEEMLLIEGIEGVLDKPAHFDAFVNLPQANISTVTNCMEYVGRFSILAQRLYTNLTGNYVNTSLRLPIGSNVEALGLSKEENLVVTLVPRAQYPYSPVSIQSIKLHHETLGLSKRHVGMNFQHPHLALA